MLRKVQTAGRLIKFYGFRYTFNYAISWFVNRIGHSWKTQIHLSQVYDLRDNSLIQDTGNLVDVDFRNPNSKVDEIEINSDSPIVWFVPVWTNVWGGGHLTIFRFANFLSRKRKNIIFVYDNAGRFSEESFEASLSEAFPGNSLTVLVNPKDIPEKMIPIATTWQSVYSLLKLSKNISKRFYFMQDYESLFYAHGTQSMQALASYEQGLIGITGGPWLLSKFREHGGDGINYMFTVDHDVFYTREYLPKKIERIFFYGRPSTERRCFELGIASLKLVKEKYPEIEIVIAGLDGIGDVGFEVTLLGSVPLPELGDLYRSCDLGIALSGTNLSYLPVELMACGVPVISNSGPQVSWYCKDGFNSLVSPPFPSSILDAVDRLIENPNLREQIIKGGIETTSATSWSKEASKIEKFIDSETKV